MKNLSFFVSFFALCASTSYAAINCSTLPTCDSLGYKDKVADCPSSSEVLKCPFDITWGKCTRGPSIGDLKYSLNTANHNGWILCNGQSLDTTKYATLYGIIKSNYGMDGTKFRVPDYRGFFLRAYGTAYNNKPLSSYGGTANSSLITPQKEELPNITGSITSTQYKSAIGETTHASHQFLGDYPYVSPNSLFELTVAGSKQGIEKSGGGTGWGVSGLHFNASRANAIYSGSHVIPANYAANIFIYAGKHM